MKPWTTLPSHRAWLDAETRRLLAFGRQAGLPDGGAAYLDADGAPDPGCGVLTWITARTVHVYGLGALLGVPGSAPVAERALAGLTGRLRDAGAGGWHHGLQPDGTPDTDAGKSCYDHAFVLLAATTATLAGLPGGRELLDDAQGVFLERFWDESTGLCVDTWDTGFTTLDTYRGLNAAMHTVEAALAVADCLASSPASGRSDRAAGRAWLDRAASVAGLVVRLAAEHDGRLPEHFDAGWVPTLDLNRDRPDDPFKPYGATVGHGLEWSRLLLQLEAALGDEAPAALAPTAVALFDRAVADGWTADGAPGFVYTTDWTGAPVVRDRMHWVAAEAVAAADALHRRTGEARFARRYAQWWDYVVEHLVDHERGSWHHQLDAANQPTGGVWPGKPDLYHVVQATLLPRVPAGAGLARALADGEVLA